MDLNPYWVLTLKLGLPGVLYCTLTVRHSGNSQVQRLSSGHSKLHLCLCHCHLIPHCLYHTHGHDVKVPRSQV